MSLNEETSKKNSNYKMAPTHSTDAKERCALNASCIDSINTFREHEIQGKFLDPSSWKHIYLFAFDRLNSHATISFQC
jgi:hypothetical protein